MKTGRMSVLRPVGNIRRLMLTCVTEKTKQPRFAGCRMPASVAGIDSEWVVGVYYYDKDVELTRDYFNWDLGQPDIFKVIIAVNMPRYTAN